VSLPAPNLDDRRFQDLVDEAKRMVQRRWPEWTGWTDHNVSDPGVTLIETFAFMVDQLLYRLNRMPDRTYVKLLDLIGLHLHPPTAAVVPVTFWLSGPQRESVVVPIDTEVATERTDTMEAVIFHTTADLEIVSCTLAAVGSAPRGGEFNELTEHFGTTDEIPLFSPKPEPGDAFYVGLSKAAPSCVVAVRLSGRVEGYGIDPQHPPRSWEAWNGSDWVECDILRDETRGFNRAGTVVLGLPPDHAMSSVGRQRAGWVRCVIIPPSEGAPPYDASPRVDRVEVFTVGGVVEAIHSRRVLGESLGTSDGSVGQEFPLQHAPVVLSPDPEVVEEIIPIAGADGTESDPIREWMRVDSFAGRGPDERVFVLDPASGVVQFPPAVRDEDGTVRAFGATPASGNELVIRAYRSGGGRIGNVASGAIRYLRSALPGVNSVENRVGAGGGVDAETIDEAKLRGPLLVRTRDRAVTAADFEHLTREAAPEVARVMCPEVSEPGTVRVLIVPEVSSGERTPGQIGFDQLRPTRETLERIGEYLEQRRVVGVRVVVETPMYQGITVVATLRARRNASPVEVRERALAALYRYYHPVIGGPEGGGWPFGRPVQAGEVHAILQRVPGVDFVEQSLLFAYTVPNGPRDETERVRIDLPPTALVFSFGHDVIVEPTL
jgi:predicted phage baseplate assembly protein